MNKQCRRVMIVLGACLVLGGCNESDLTSIRIKLNSDGSGTVKVITASVPAEPSPVKRASQGTAWTQRVSVNASRGAFASVSALAVAGITFDADLSNDGMGRLEVVVPIGPKSRWIKTITPLSENQRTELAEVFDPTGKIESIGSSIRIVVELPGEVVFSGAFPTSGGVSSSHNDDTATLTVPVDTVVPGYGSVRWHITWTLE